MTFGFFFHSVETIEAPFFFFVYIVYNKINRNYLSSTNIIFTLARVYHDSYGTFNVLSIR